MSAPKATTRSTVVGALRFTLASQSPAVVSVVKPRLMQFFNALADPDYLTRLAALQTLSLALTKCAPLIYDLIGRLLPMVYAETPVKPDLVRKVKVGPITVTYDDASDNRKLAFECMLAILGMARDKINFSEFSNCCINGLGDTQLDIVLHCCQILQRAAGPALLQALDPSVPKFTEQLVKVAPTREADLPEFKARLTATIKTVYHLDKIPGADSCVVWSQFMTDVVKGKEEIRKEFEWFVENGPNTSQGTLTS